MKRRRFLEMVALGGAAGLAWRFGGGGDSARVVRRSRVLMGTVANLTLVGDDPELAARAADACLDRMSGLEALLSGYRPDSQLSTLNRTGQLESAGEDLIKLLQLSRELADGTDGAFDISVGPLVDLFRRCRDKGAGLPTQEHVQDALKRVDYKQILVDGRRVSFQRPGMSITIDGIGKGFVIDAGVALLRESGFLDVMVEAGGDLVASGGKGGGRPWKIGIRSPRGGMREQLLSIDVQDRAVATSGDYMQPFSDDRLHHHIIDPRTGYSSPELACCTVQAPTAALADGLATAAMVLGERRSLQLLEGRPGCEGYLLTKSLRPVHTSGFPVA